jgi:hypothetical protein
MFCAPEIQGKALSAEVGLLASLNNEMFDPWRDLVR